MEVFTPFVVLLLSHSQGFAFEITQLPTVEALDGSNVVLLCSVSSEIPVGPVKWFKKTGSERQHFFAAVPRDNEKSDPRVTWAVENSPLNFSIKVEKVRASDAGDYSCEKYKKGEDNKVHATGGWTALIVREKPQMPGPTQSTKKNGDGQTKKVATANSVDVSSEFGFLLEFPYLWIIIGGGFALLLTVIGIITWVFCRRCKARRRAARNRGPAHSRTGKNMHHKSCIHANQQPQNQPLQNQPPQSHSMTHGQGEARKPLRKSRA
ncbi:tyrosine-protein phosphatase non-receptor type substrate 1-like [Erpetoichthys calabaricus]|uniref:tyrosine-protein phosphatase non-receptor type substrate 1-like n=1 Tax=Erpetoichthys calabaricus TaxID=27687 RepID=UPI00109F5F66|nr:tyrosine-protein phosphatase non-receptor type substrate 1-like [Erpetoichthys calabaricus]